MCHVGCSSLSKRVRAAGIITGDIRVGGFPKVQHTFARVMGYVEQSDIHSPMVRLTVCTGFAHVRFCFGVLSQGQHLELLNRSLLFHGGATMLGKLATIECRLTNMCASPNGCVLLA